MPTPHHSTVYGHAGDPATCSSSQVGWWGSLYEVGSLAAHPPQT